MDHIFKFSFLFSLLFVLPGLVTQAKNLSPNFDKAAFYLALASAKVDEVNAALAVLKESTIAEKQAYEGALLMKKAGLVNKAKEKLSLFRSGRVKLEAAIKTDPANVEYHFLRLVIQENAPKIVRYKMDLKDDAELVRTSFKKLSPDVQKAVRDYSKKSNCLKPAGF